MIGQNWNLSLRFKKTLVCLLDKGVRKVHLKHLFDIQLLKIKNYAFYRPQFLSGVVYNPDTVAFFCNIIWRLVNHL